MPCILDRIRQHGPRGDERGSTLVEVLAASAILTILVLGLSTLWTTVGRLSFDELLGQKAVFVLNGEMERLDSLYTTSSFGAGTRNSSTGYPSITNISGSGTRLSYDTSSVNASFVTKSLSTLQGNTAAVWETGSFSSTRNYVWLDQNRGILGRISWMEESLSLCGVAETGGQNIPCGCYSFSGFLGTILPGNCIELVLVLEYPFTVQSGAPVQMPNQTLRTITLSTIVGRRA
jgi:Tfp pilus assembly protein PilV